MHSLHVEFELHSSAGLSECAAALLRYDEGAPTLLLLHVEPGTYPDIHALCRAVTSAAAAMPGFVCEMGDDGHVLCRASELWRPYVNGDETAAALSEQLWTILGFDACAAYDNATQHRAASWPHYCVCFDAVKEFAPPAVEMLAQESLSTAGRAVQSVYGARRTALLRLEHLSAECAARFEDMTALAAQGRRLRLYIAGTMACEARLDCSGDSDPLPQRMYQGCAVYALELPLVISENGEET